MESLVILTLTTLASAFVGSFLAGYLKRKGENLATHEDIGKLTEQVAAVTQTTKEIEAKISSDVWDRQKRWELKREVLYEATKRAAQLNDALNFLHITLEITRTDPIQDDLDLLRRKKEVLTRWNKAVSEFTETMLWVGVVCGKETALAVQALGAAATSFAVAFEKGEGDYEKAMSQFSDKIIATGTAIRKELGIDALDQPPPAGSA
jgi:hypothetical protein